MGNYKKEETLPTLKEALGDIKSVISGISDPRIAMETIKRIATLSLINNAQGE